MICFTAKEVDFSLDWCWQHESALEEMWEKVKRKPKKITVGTGKLDLNEALPQCYKNILERVEADDLHGCRNNAFTILSAFLKKMLPRD